MTIALGMVANGGLVFAADTQQTSGQYFKTSSSKICRVQVDPGSTDHGNRACIITGAGTSSYIETMQQELAVIFSQQDRAILTTEQGGAFGASIAGFYSAHVIPLAVFPADERPDFSLIIGTQYEHRTGGMIWASDKTTIREGLPYVAVGIGHASATSLLNRLWRFVDLRSAVLLAAYVIYQTKQSIEGCGRETEIVVLRNGRVTALAFELTRELELLFERYTVTEANALYYALGGEATENFKF